MSGQAVLLMGWAMQNTGPLSKFSGSELVIHWSRKCKPMRLGQDRDENELFGRIDDVQPSSSSSGEEEITMARCFEWGCCSKSSISRERNDTYILVMFKFGVPIEMSSTHSPEHLFHINSYARSSP